MTPTSAPRGDDAGAGQLQRPIRGAAFYTHVVAIAHTQARAATPLFGATPSSHLAAGSSHAAAPGFFVDAASASAFTATTTTTPASTSATPATSNTKPASTATQPWDRTLQPLTLPAIIHTRSADIPDPQDPRRARQLEREREEFRNRWITGNVEIRRPDGDSESRVPVIVGDNGRTGNTELEGVEASGDSSGGSEGRERARCNSSSGSRGDAAALDEAASARVNVFVAKEAESVEAPSQHSRSDGKRSDDLHTRAFTALDTSTHVKEASAECKELAPKKAIQEDTADISSEKLSGGTPDETIKKLEPTQPAIRCENPDISSTAASTPVPELLDEDVGGIRIAPFLGKKSRPTITLHLSSHGATDSKKDDQQIRPTPEIRIADSSVPDDENSVKDSAKKCTYKRHSTTDASTAKRPRIIEDLTCVEGTIFGKLALSKSSQPAAESSPAKKPKLEETSEDELSCDATKNKFDNKTDVINAEATNKSKMRRKFRQLFGRTLTLSEIEEENELMDETMPRKRRKEWRLSLDSGVSLSELNSERISASPDAELREMTGHSIGKQFPAEQDELISIKSEEKDIDDDPLAPSMPLLDSFPLQNISNKTKDAISATQPDSSTTFEDKSEANLGGKLKILITPIDTVGVGSFAPMSLEIDITDGSLVSTTTSTTDLSVAAKYSKNENEDHEDLSKLLEMDVKRDCHITQQGNTISIQEEVNARIIPSWVATAEEDVEMKSRVADITVISAEGNAVTRHTRCGPDAGETIVDRQDLTSQSQDLDDKTISSATELRFNDKIVDFKDSQHETPLPTETQYSDQRTVNISSATCNYDFQFEAKYSCQRNVTSSATEDADSSKLSTSVDFAPELEKIAIKKELPDVGETQEALKDVETSQKALTDVEETQKALTGVEKIKKEVPDFDDTIKKELPDAENPATAADRENKESTEIAEPHVASSAAPATTEKDRNSKNHVPKPNIRVLHHSELGSRWCPTPFNGNAGVSSIPEAQKIPQYQSPPVNPTTQGPINAKAAHPANETHYLHFLITSQPVCPPATTSNQPAYPPPTTSSHPNSTSKDVNCRNFPQAQPVLNSSVQQGTTSTSNAPPTPATVNCQSSAPNGNSTEFHVQVVRNIINRLTILNSCLECCRFVQTVNDLAQIRQIFYHHKYKLAEEFMVIYRILGTNNYGVVVPWLFKYYPRFVRPEDRCLSIERILNILALKDLPPPIYVAQTQMQGVPAATAVAHRQPATVAASRRPENVLNSRNSAVNIAPNLRNSAVNIPPNLRNPAVNIPPNLRNPAVNIASNSRNSAVNIASNSRNSAVNIAANVQPCASASQPEFTRPQTKPKAIAPKQNRIFSDAHLRRLIEQIVTYEEIYRSVNRQLAEVHLRQVAAHQATLRPAPREMTLQDKLKRTAQRATDQWLMSLAAAPVPVEDNSANKQTELRQSPGTLSQRQNQATAPQRRVYPTSTFVPRPVNVSGAGVSQPDAQLMSEALKLQTLYRGATTCSQPTIPVSVENLNPQQRQSSLSTGNFASQDPKFTAGHAEIPVPVQDIYFQQQTRRSPAAVSTQRSTSQNSINGSRRSPVEMENVGAQIEQRRSSLSSTQQNPPKTLMVCINLPNTAATMDNGLRLGPAASSANSTGNFTALAGTNACDTWTSIPTEMTSTVAHIQPQRSPVPTVVQQIQQSNQTNIPVPVDNNVGTPLQPQRSPVATRVQQIQQSNQTNIPVPVDNNVETPLQQLCSSAATRVQQIQQSNQTHIPVPVDNNIGVPLQQQCSSAATRVQQIQQSNQTNTRIPVENNSSVPLQQQCSSAATIDYEITLEDIIRYNLENTVSADDIDVQPLSRLTPDASSAESTEKSATPTAANCSSTWTSSPTQIDNTDAPIQCKPEPTELNLKNTVSADDIDVQSESRLTPDASSAESTEKSATLAAANCSSTWTSTPTQIDNTDAPIQCKPEPTELHLENTVSADDIDVQPESRLTPAASSAESTEKSATLAAANSCSTWMSSPTQIDNTDAPIQCKPEPTELQQITPEEPIGSILIVDDYDDSCDQFELRLSPASTIEDTTATDSVHCNNTTSIPQESPPSNQSSPPEELSLCLSPANFASTNDNAEAQLEPESCPAAAQHITADDQESVALHSRRNIPVSVISSNDKVDLPERSPTTATHQTVVETPVIFDPSLATATDGDCSVEVAREQQEERQSPPAPISGNTASGTSEISNGSTDNGCNVRVVDVLEALDALSSIKTENRSISSASCRPTEEPQTKLLSTDAGGASENPIATNDAENTNVQEKHREENDHCESFQSEGESIALCGDSTSISAEVKSTGEQMVSNNESTVLCGDSTDISLRVDGSDVPEIEDDQITVSAASPVPVITIDDDDDDDEDDDLELFILEDCESSKESKDAEAAEAEQECKVEMLPESVEAAREAEKEEMVSSWEIENETSEVFSILDVKSISKDVFNNMGEGGQVEELPTPEKEESMVIDSVDIKDDEAVNCSRCGKLSSVACAQCRSASYCSTECHQIHWTEIHYLSCKPVPEDDPAQS